MKLSLGQTRLRLILTALALCTMLGSSCVSSNNHPVITSLKAEKDSVVPLGICEVHCVASDVNGDSLTYNWASSGGTFLGTGMITTWTAPDMPGTYTITVTVTDGRDGEAVMQLAIDVEDNNPPVIQSLTADLSVVEPGSSTNIECVAYDPDGDELSHLWTKTGGDFSETSVSETSVSEKGSIATWTAPDMPGTYTITVTVTDGRDGETVMQLAIDVEDNNPPVIQSLTADLLVVEPGRSTSIECVAYDPDGDELTYLWTKTGGDFSEASVSEKGSIATWTAPEVGQSYFIAVFVDDGRGGEASKVLEIRVKKLD